MQNNNSLATFLAAEVKSEVAQKALFDTGISSVIYALAANPNLSKSLWIKIAKIRSDVNLTFKLVSAGRRDLDEDQLRLILKDPRSRIRDNSFYYLLGNISRDFFNEILASGKLNRQHAASWLFGERIPPELLVEVAAIDRGYAQAELLKLRYLYSDQQAITALPEIEATRNWSMSALWELFDFRPELLPTAITLANEHILTAALSSRHLFDEALFIKALSRTTANADEWDTTLIASIVMSHPNATEPAFKAAAELLRSSYSPYDGGQEVADLAISSRAARRENGPVTYPITIPWEQLPEESLALVLEAYKASEYRYPTLFTWESAGRVFGPEPKDPHLAETFIYQTALDQIGDGGGYISTSCISQEQLSNEIERPLDAIGYKAWQAFIELSINWSLSTAELLQTTLGLF